MLNWLLRWLGMGEASVSPVSVEPVTFTNEIPDTIIHIGDGRKLRFGESAEVTPQIARQLKSSR